MTDSRVSTLSSFLATKGALFAASAGILFVLLLRRHKKKAARHAKSAVDDADAAAKAFYVAIAAANDFNCISQCGFSALGDPRSELPFARPLESNEVAPSGRHNRIITNCV